MSLWDTGSTPLIKGRPSCTGVWISGIRVDNQYHFISVISYRSFFCPVATPPALSLITTVRILITKDQVPLQMVQRNHLREAVMIKWVCPRTGPPCWTPITPYLTRCLRTTPPNIHLTCMMMTFQQARGYGAEKRGVVYFITFHGLVLVCCYSRGGV